MEVLVVGLPIPGSFKKEKQSSPNCKSSKLVATLTCWLLSRPELLTRFTLVLVEEGNDDADDDDDDDDGVLVFVDESFAFIDCVCTGVVCWLLGS